MKSSDKWFISSQPSRCSDSRLSLFQYGHCLLEHFPLGPAANVLVDPTFDIRGLAIGYVLSVSIRASGRAQDQRSASHFSRALHQPAHQA